MFNLDLKVQKNHINLALSLQFGIICLIFRAATRPGQPQILSDSPIPEVAGPISRLTDLSRP